jgi:hypothetical protein
MNAIELQISYDGFKSMITKPHLGPCVRLESCADTIFLLYYYNYGPYATILDNDDILWALILAWQS